ncbi:MAG: hypothetical protein AAF577_16770, partial [Pseudomonadota bacterium]
MYVQDICLTAVKPFSVEVNLPNTNGADSITVVDATGKQQVPIGFDMAQAGPEQFGPLQSSAEKDEYRLWAVAEAGQRSSGDLSPISHPRQGRVSGLIAVFPNLGPPGAMISGLFHGSGPDAPPCWVSDIGTVYPIALWGRSSL